MQVKSIAKCSLKHSAILSTFIKLPFVFKTFVLAFLSGRLRQVLLYLACFAIKSLFQPKLECCKLHKSIDNPMKNHGTGGANFPTVNRVINFCNCFMLYNQTSCYNSKYKYIRIENNLFHMLTLKAPRKKCI